MTKTKDDELNELCVRQYIRSKFGEIMLKYMGKPELANEALEDINSTIVNDFVKIAKDEVKNIMVKLSH